MTRPIDDLYDANEFNKKLILEYSTKLHAVYDAYYELVENVNKTDSHIKEEAITNFLNKMEKIVGC